MLNEEWEPFQIACCEIRVKRIRVNQGVGVLQKYYYICTYIFKKCVGLNERGRSQTTFTRGGG